MDVNDLIKKFERSNFLEEIKLQLITSKYFGIVFPTCYLIVFGYSSWNISSTIRDLKLEGMPKYKQVWTWYTDIFSLCFWLARNYTKICFRNISSAKLKWKDCSRRIKHSQLTPTHFSSWWFFCANSCHLLSFLNNHKIIMSQTFAF